MHEMGICNGILAASFDAAKEQGATRITEIHISVGELSEVVDYALQFAFESLSPGTMAEDATLFIESISPRSRCTMCGTEFDHGRFDAICPECGNPFNEPIQGRELRIDSIEVDLPDEKPEADTGSGAPAKEQ